MNTFNHDVERGKFGENLVKSYFAEQGCYIEDVTQDPQYQQEDIDLVVADGTTYEVKTDYKYWKTGNLVLEAKVHLYKSGIDKDGWLYQTTADKIAFVNAHNPRCFISIGVDKLREIVENERLRTYWTEEGYKSVLLYLLPPRQYKEFFEQHLLEGGAVYA